LPSNNLNFESYVRQIKREAIKIKPNNFEEECNKKMD